jgi:PhnB protein
MVKPVPEGYHTVTPFLNLVGCDKALEFYKQAFGAEERLRMPAPDGKIAHAEMQIGNSVVMLSEAVRQPATQSSLWLYVPDCDALWSRAVAAGAKVLMPLTDMFWGDRFGTLSDDWGNHWSLATHKEDLSEEEIGKRAQAALAQMK